MALDAMYSLPNRQLEMLYLFAVEGLSVSEIGDVLGIQPATAKADLCHARNAMRRRLPELWTDKRQSGEKTPDMRPVHRNTLSVQVGIYDSLDDYLCHELAAIERKKFESHLEGCAACRLKVRGAQRLNQTLQRAVYDIDGQPSANHLRKAPGGTSRPLTSDTCFTAERLRTMTAVGSVVVLLLLAVLVVRNTDERMSAAQPAVTRSVSQRAERTVVPDESTAETSPPTVQLRGHVIGVPVETFSSCLFIRPPPVRTIRKQTENRFATEWPEEMSMSAGVGHSSADPDISTGKRIARCSRTGDFRGL